MHCDGIPPHDPVQQSAEFEQGAPSEKQLDAQTGMP